MIQAYSMRGKDNDLYMIGSCKTRLDGVPATVFCSTCGWKIDWEYTRSDFKLGTCRLDVSVTYDGACIISRRVQQILREYCANDELSRQLASETEYFHLLPKDVLRFDVERRKTRFGNICETCKLPSTVAGASPPYFKDSFPQDRHMLRTDTMFGSYNERHPLIIISVPLANKMRELNLSGVELEPIGVEQFRAP